MQISNNMINLKQLYLFLPPRIRKQYCIYKQLPPKLLLKETKLHTLGYSTRSYTEIPCSSQAAPTTTSDELTIDENIDGIGRRSVGYEPSPWGSYFFSCSPRPPQNFNIWTEKRTSELKEEVRKMLTYTTDNLEMMHLIDAIQRLGIGYHFEKEIENALANLHNAKFESDNLQYVALRFRLLRQNGFLASAGDEFCKFKDGERFDDKLCEDVRGLLSLYNAGFLAIPGEDILDEAVSFSKSILKSKVDQLSSPLKKQVLRALEMPLHKMIPRVEAMFYIEEYEEEETRIDILLELAKIDFNSLQTIYYQEMKDLALWWKDQNIEENLKYARDRIAESYLLGLAIYFEPQYSRARTMVAKFVAMIAVVNDSFDVYGTIEECKLFNDAIQRWTVEAAEELPNCLRGLCLKFINMIADFEDELEHSEKYRIPYFIESVQTLIKAFTQEAEWHANQQTPSFNERKKRSVDGNTNAYLSSNVFIGMGGEVVSEEAFRWLHTIPDVVLHAAKILRYTEDVLAYERESKGQCPSTLMCYMMEHNLTKEEATEKFLGLIEDSWKRLNQACLRRPTPYPRTILERLVNYSRGMAVMYFYRDDGFVKCSHVKDLIAFLLLKPFSLNEKLSRSCGMLSDP